MTTALRDLYGLIGDPVAHSVSPDIHAAALARLSRHSAYLPFHVLPDDLSAAIAGARVLGVKGLNVTIPHKERAAEIVDALEGDAAAIGAVNVIVNRDGQLIGFNTDTLAVQAAVKRRGFDPEGKRALVLGAGGAARAAAFALGRAGLTEVIVANRTFDRANELCLELSKMGIDAIASPLTPGALKELVPMAQVIVNATSVGLGDADASPLPEDVEFDPDALAIEMVYRPLKTRFLNLARDANIDTVDGLDILIHQGIESLRLWLNRPIDATRIAPLMRTAALEGLL